MDDVLLTEVDEGIAVLTMNRAGSLNALNGALRSALVETLDTLDARPDVGCIVLTGTGRAFCAGLDVKELEASGRTVSDNVGDRDIGAAITRLRTPLIAAVNGLAVTGGFEITLSCDMVVAAESAWFQDTHAKIGLLPGWGLSQRLPRTIGLARAKELSLTARRVTAAEAAELGFVNRVVPDAGLRGAAEDMARAVAQWDPAHLVRIKALMNEGYALPLGQALEHEAKTAAELNRQVTLGKEGRG